MDDEVSKGSQQQEGGEEAKEKRNGREEGGRKVYHEALHSRQKLNEGLS